MLDRFDPAFVRRLISALVLGLVVIVDLWRGGWAFAALVMIAGGFMVYEYARIAARLSGRLGFHPLSIVAGGVATWAGTLAVTLGHTAQGLVLVMVTATLAAIGAALLGRTDGDRGAFAAIYIGLPCVSILHMRLAYAGGFELVIWIFAVIWTTDTAAYLVGRTVGGPKLAPSISPGKTWSGSVGGAIGGTLMGMLVAHLSGVSAFGALPASLLVSIAGQAGDLFESRLKRVAGLKDSGTAIPGHGGVLDRVDALLFAAPVTAAIVAVWGPGVLR